MNSQQSTACLYPEPDEFSPLNHILFPYDGE